MLFHIASLIFGAGAWSVAAFAIATQKVVTSLKSMVFSFCFCAVSLLFQIFEINRLVKIKDCSAILDTSNAVFIASLILITVTIILNSVAMIKSNNKS